MKLQSTLLALVTLAIFTLSACDKEDDAKKNSFKYNQKEAEIGTAFGFAFGQTEVSGVYAVAMEFFEKSFTVHYVGGYPDSLSGKGDALLLTFLSEKETEIPTGEYTVKISSAAPASFKIDTDDETGLVVGYDAATNDDPAFIEITSGSVKVTKNGDDYEFTFNLSTNENSTITGYYKGKPVIFSDKKKKSSVNNSRLPSR